MGSGSSRVHQVDRLTQVPSPSKGRRRILSPPLLRKPISHSRRPYSSQSSPWLTRQDTQGLQSNNTLAPYADIWEPNGKVNERFFYLTIFI